MCGFWGRLSLTGFLLGLLAFGAWAQDAPRLGKYKIFSYGAVGRPPLFLGHFELQSGGKYQASNTSGNDYYGGGEYSFDGTSVIWLSGPFKSNGWSGTFSLEREGKTHKIRLTPRTIATNSTD